MAQNGGRAWLYLIAVAEPGPPTFYLDCVSG